MNDFYTPDDELNKKLEQSQVRYAVAVSIEGLPIPLQGFYETTAQMEIELVYLDSHHEMRIENLNTGLGIIDSFRSSMHEVCRLEFEDQRTFTRIYAFTNRLFTPHLDELISILRKVIEVEPR